MSIFRRHSAGPLLAWIDTESANLWSTTDGPVDPPPRLLEIGLLLTDGRFRPYGPGLQITLRTDDVEAVAHRMPPIVREMHEQSGLLHDLRNPHLPTLLEAQHTLVAHCDQYAAGRQLIIAGRNVHNHDRPFLTRDLPDLAGRLHPYRRIDVCHDEWKESVMRPRRYRTRPRLHKTHRALADIEMSIRQARHFNRFLFLPWGV